MHVHICVYIPACMIVCLYICFCMLCVHAYMYIVYINAYMCICVHVCIPACVFVYYVCVRIHVYVYRYACTCVYVCLSVCVYAWVYVYIFIYMCACLYVRVYICFYYVYEAFALLFPSLSCHNNPKQNKKPNKIFLFPLHSYILFPLHVFRTFPWEMILNAAGMRLHNPQTEGMRTQSPRSLWPGTAGSRILLSVPELQITQT